MIQDLGAHRLKNQYDPVRTPQPEDFVICWQEQKMLIARSDTLCFPRVADLPNADGLVYLFQVDDQAFFLTLRPVDLPDFDAVSMRQLRMLPRTPKEYVFAAFTAMHLAEWYRRKQFCGTCGGPLVHDSAERAMVCPRCGERYYPRINPAVIVGVINGDRLLVTRYRQGAGMSALIAGFTEIGETLEETVSREVMEEAGIRVRDIRYYKSQPWGIASDILAGFFCHVDGDDTIRMDENELRYARWVPRKEIVLQPMEYSLTNEMMKLFKEGRI